DRPREDDAAAAAALPRRDRPRTARAVRLRQRHADPRRGQGRRQHGRRRGRAGREADGRRGARPDRDHRPEAARAEGAQVHRAVQAARGHADRREGHPPRRPDVGVPGPAAEHRAAAYPGLPRAVADAVRRQRQLHVRSERAVDVPRDRHGPGGPAARDGHHRRHHRSYRRGGTRAAPPARVPLPHHRDEEL
ncbi:MAG: LSU ribosomal protein L5p (L11e), partial [uncultured Corynebacteriales bacterium]